MQCSADADCGFHAACGSEGICEAFPLGANIGIDLAAGVLSFLIAGISLAAGVGGGGLFVPLVMGILSFDSRTATALSQSMLFGGATAAFLYNIRHSHPRVRARPLVDWELACLLGPALMAGAQIGSVAHATAPPAVLLLLLCVVLSDAARKGFASARKISAKEREDAAAAATDAAAAATAPVKEVELADETASESEGTEETESYTPDDEEATARIRDAQFRLVFVWLVCVAVVLGKGLLLKICSPGWWLLVVGCSVCLGFFALHYASLLSGREPVDMESVDFRELAYPLVRWSFLAGGMAAVCGIGGGMVMGPILVGLKVPPPISAATTATTLLVLSSSISLVYMCRGFAPMDYSIFLSICTTGGALTGKTLVGRWVRATGKESVIVWCLAGITILSTVLMGGLGSFRVLENGAASFQVTNLCAEGD